MIFFFTIQLTVDDHSLIIFIIIFFFLGILKGDKSIPHARTELLKNYMFEEIMTNVKENYIPETSSESISHPVSLLYKLKF